MGKSKLIKVSEKIADEVTSSFKKMSDGVVSGFKKINDTVVNDYTKIENKFVDQYLAKDGESVEDAKKRLKEKQVQKDLHADKRSVKEEK